MSFMLEGDSPILARQANRVATFRYFPEQGYEPLAYVRCLDVHWREGAEPSLAEFEYISQNADPNFDPVYFENVLPLMFRQSGGQMVYPDDRIVVVCLTPSGDFRYMFDGFCVNPDTRFAARGHQSSYTVGFKAAGVEKRCWDAPLQASWQRDCSDPTDASKNVNTALPIRFNPKGRPNRTPKDSDMMPPGALPQSIPIFLDVDFKGVDADKKPYQQMWNLYDFARYVIAIGNPEEEYVTNPDFRQMESVLSVYTPKKDAKGRPGKYYDINKPETYDKRPITISDVDAKGGKWPEVLARVLDANGFSMAFRLAIDASGDTPQPYTYLDIYKKYDNDPTKYKDLYLAPWDNPLDPAVNNVSEMEVFHDTSRVVNKVTLHTAPEWVEVSIVLAPLFPIAPGDYTDKGKFILGKTAPADVRKYRQFGADEAGLGHWNLVNWVYSHTSLDLDAIFPPDRKPDSVPDDEDEPEKRRRYFRRGRPARNQLVTADDDGKPLEPKLHISFNYTGETPAVWDGESGDWVEIPDGKGWVLLKDQFGIRLTEKDPNAWKIGDMKGVDLSVGEAQRIAGGEIRTVEWLRESRVASPTQWGNFFLMLTGVMEADQMAKVVADRRPASPTTFTIESVVEAASEYQPKRLYRNSWNEVARGSAADKDFVIFDQDMAQAYVDTKRESSQLGQFSMKVAIPRLTAAYTIGDRIRQINGRDCSFAMNLTGGIETTAYPKVIGFTWHCGHGERTSLILSDTAIIRRRLARRV
jgi:hypothetical protein